MQRSPLYLLSMLAFALGGFLTLWLAFTANATPIAQATQPAAPDATTELRVTVGTVPNVCAPTNTITVSQGATVYYCYYLENKSKYTLRVHRLIDPAIGLHDQFTLTMTPSGGMTPALEIPSFAALFQPTHSMVTWIATSTQALTFTAQSQAHVYMPMLAVTATVGVDPQACGAHTQIDADVGTQVYYCYAVHNPGSMTLTVPAIDGGGANLHPQPPLLLAPGATVHLTATAMVSQTTNQTISMTGYTKNNLTTLAQTQTTVRVPAIGLRATAGLDDSQCAAADTLSVPVGTRVIYCYTITNLGGVPLTQHRVAGSTIPRGSRDISFTLDSSANVFFAVPVTETRAHTVTWIAWNGDNLTATAQALITTTALTTLTVAAFYDVNGAKGREPGEPSVSKIQLTLTYPNGVSLTKMSDITGTIVFTNLPARLYTATIRSFDREPYILMPNTSPYLDLRNKPALHTLFAFTLSPSTDDDNDGIPNWQEGAGDEDGDGIRNYLDYSPKVFITVIRRTQ